ncbi:hypothetical protein L596_018843 [Steinernema carpocapsae]|uniref:Uncharacterized protein n=1 Tax=Steinernema carpocapsae TaxID=34508 RepID=A0A4U5N626_STECR|nr:hypothetical protein L596_018843 [Steinernema carpocapsae]
MSILRPLLSSLDHVIKRKCAENFDRHSNRCGGTRVRKTANRGDKAPPPVPPFSAGAPVPAPVAVAPSLAPAVPPLPSPTPVVPVVPAVQHRTPQSLAPIHVKAAKVASKPSPKKSPVYFVDNFDVRECAKKPEFIAQQFARKFPRRALTKDKVATFENFLALRLRECQKKEAVNHWEHIEGALSAIRISAIEEDECRSGLVQEQIACSNIYSYACQFAQKSFRFRSQPAKTIIQEARLAEDGAEKCRKIVKVIKKKMEQKSKN